MRIFVAKLGCYCKSYWIWGVINGLGLLDSVSQTLFVRVNKVEVAV